VYGERKNNALAKNAPNNLTGKNLEKNPNHARVGEKRSDEDTYHTNDVDYLNDKRRNHNPEKEKVFHESLLRSFPLSNFTSCRDVFLINPSTTEVKPIY
jgi:hypothetical protein